MKNVTQIQSQNALLNVESNSVGVFSRCLYTIFIIFAPQISSLPIRSKISLMILRFKISVMSSNDLFKFLKHVMFSRR